MADGIAPWPWRLRGVALSQRRADEGCGNQNRTEVPGQEPCDCLRRKLETRGVSRAAPDSTQMSVHDSPVRKGIWKCQTTVVLNWPVYKPDREEQYGREIIAQRFFQSGRQWAIGGGQPCLPSLDGHPQNWGSLPLGLTREDLVHLYEGPWRGLRAVVEKKVIDFHGHPFQPTKQALTERVNEAISARRNLRISPTI